MELHFGFPFSLCCPVVSLCSAVPALLYSVCMLPYRLLHLLAPTRLAPPLHPTPSSHPRGSASSQLCYAYFMATRRDFSWEAALERHVGQWEKRQLAAAGIDLQRFSWLRREARRLRELLAAQEAAEAAATAAASEEGQDGEPGAAYAGKKEA